MREFTSSAEMIENYRQVHARLWPMPVRVIPEPESIVEEAPPPVLEVVECDTPAVPAEIVRCVHGVTRVQRIVAAYYGISVEAMLARTHKWRVARRRQVGMYVAKITTDKSLPEIGRRFGGRDHTTVLHGIKRIARLIEADEEFASEIAEIMDAVRGDTDSSVDQTDGSGRG